MKRRRSCVEALFVICSFYCVTAYPREVRDTEWMRHVVARWISNRSNWINLGYPRGSDNTVFVRRFYLTHNGHLCATRRRPWQILLCATRNLQVRCRVYGTARSLVPSFPNIHEDLD